MPISSVGRVSNARGVTLIEMLVVVCIIALIAAIALPSVSTGIDSVRLHSASGSIASFLNSAVNRAERLQDAVEVTISPKEGALFLRSAQSNYKNELHMPSGVIIEAVLPKQEGVWGEEDPTRRLILMPGAAIPAIGIQIANHHGTRRIIRLDPMTGYPRVESVGKEE